VTDLHSPDSLGRLRLTVGSLPLVLDISGSVLQVYSKDGGVRYDPQGAEVIMALGGEEPEWLPVVEALMCVHHYFPEEAEALVDAGNAIGRSNSSRSQIARESQSVPVLIGLAAYGQKQVAVNPLLDERMWTLLRHHRNETVTREVLAFTNVLPPQLALYPDPETRIRVANNPECPPGTLSMLSLDGSSERIRLAVARNVNAPKEALHQLSGDEDANVRRAVASNRSVSRGTLDDLLRDRYAHVRVAAISNPELPRRAAAARVVDPTPTVHIALASRSDMRSQDLIRIEKFSRRDPPRFYAQVRQRLRQHPECPPRLEERLDKIDKRIAASSQRQARRLDRVELVFTLPVVIIAAGVSGVLIVFAIVAAAKGRFGEFAGLGAIGVLGAAATLVLIRRLLHRFPPSSGTYWQPPRPQDVNLLLVLLEIGIVFTVIGLANNGYGKSPLVPSLVIVGAVIFVRLGAAISQSRSKR